MERLLGTVAVTPVALGTGTLGIRGQEDDAASIDLLRTAVDAGITVIDTALAYTCAGEPSHGERLVREALRNHSGSAHVVVATKGGHFRQEDSSWAVDGRPEALRQHCEISLRTLAVDCLDLYQLHWPDPLVPFAESVGALEDLRTAGMLRRIGLSNVSIDQLEVARRITTVTSVQNPLSPYDRSDLAMAQLCGRLGIAYLAYSPLGGPGRAQQLAATRPAFAAVAARHGVNAQQIALAWLLSCGPTVIPVVGASSLSSVRSSLAAMSVELTEHERSMLDVEVLAADQAEVERMRLSDGRDLLLFSWDGSG